MRPSLLHEALEIMGEACARPECYEPPAPWSLHCRDHARSASWRDESDAGTRQRVMRRKHQGRAVASGW